MRWMHWTAGNDKVGFHGGGHPRAPSFDGPLRGMMGSREVAADLKAMGFDMMNRANNHLFEGRIAIVGMHTTDGRFDGPVSALGIPRTSPPEIAQRILTRVQKLSTAFGTAMTIEGGVGVIRAQPRSTSQP